MPRPLLIAIGLLAALLLGGCAGVLPQVERVPTHVQVASPDTPLGKRFACGDARPCARCFLPAP